MAYNERSATTPASDARGCSAFSNPRHEHEGAPLGVPYTGDGESGVTGPADAATVLNATGPSRGAVAESTGRPQPGADGGQESCPTGD